MRVLRTPNEVLAAMKDYPFTAHYRGVVDENSGVHRVHFVYHGDEGPRDAVPFLQEAKPMALIALIDSFSRA